MPESRHTEGDGSAVYRYVILSAAKDLRTEDARTCVAEPGIPGALVTRPRYRVAWQSAFLAIIVVAYAFLALGYARATPRWNNPDEPAHFNYVVHVARTGQLPVLEPGDWDAELLARLTTDWFPNDYEIAAIRYEGHQPPLYYLLGAAVHRLTWDLPLQRQVLALKALSILFGAVTIVAAFVVARELVPDRPELAILAGATVAFVPMFTAISAAINNDGLAIALASVTLAALSIGWRRGFGVRGALALGVLLGFVLLSKLTIYVYVPLALATLYLRERRGPSPEAASRPAPLPVRRGEGRPPSPAHREVQGKGPRIGWGLGGEGLPTRASRFTAVAGIVSLSISSWWLLRNVAVYGPVDPLGLLRHDAVVVGQPRWDAFVPPADLHALDFFFRILFRSFWGVFGWMGVILDDGFYVLYLVLTLLALLGLLLPWARRSGHGPPLDLRAPWLIWASIMLVFAEVAYYNLTFVQPQGRYLFPALVPLGVALSVGWCRLADTARAHRRLGSVPAGLLAAALGWSFGEWHGAFRATELWSDNALVTTALVAGGLVLAAPGSWRSRLAVVLVGLTALALGLLDYAALVRFVAPAFPAR